MLKRIYADNFRSLVNFEIKLDRINLLLGDNGSGKTAFFDILYRLQQFVAGNAKVAEVFSSNDLTSWQTNATQRFEIDLTVGDEAYHYQLVIEHVANRRVARIKTETLLLGGKKLFDFQDGTTRIFNDDSILALEFAGTQWEQSGLVLFGLEQTRRFCQEMQKIIIAGVQPALMSSESREESSSLSRHMENFTSWYRYLSLEHQGAMLAIFPELKRVLPGFNSCNLKEAGEAKVLKVLFDRPDGHGRPIAFDFKALSDGQRVLIALYTVLYGLKDEGISLFLDEPDNFVALREIQPWLTALADFTGEGIEQAVLISHHPDIINYLAPSSGRWFERESNVPTRVSDQPKAAADGLTMAETVARGWEK